MSEQKAAKKKIEEYSNQPKMFGDYLLLTRFAKGGMGEVYLAKTGHLRGLERFCVLKKLRADVQHEEEYLRRFLDEARLVLQLSHSNICHVFDVGQVNNELYLAMEYVSGANLRDLYLRCQKANIPLTDGYATYITSELLEALDYAHRFKHTGSGENLHIVHRDVSPQNILLSFEGEVKLIDFGLAESEMKTEQTESQVVMGKVAYMSPEQARGDELGPASDQFSAAILFYELLANKRYYGELSNYQIWQVVGSGEFTPKDFENLPYELQDILGKALAANPAQRFQSCGEMKDHLDLYLQKNHAHMNKKRLREKMMAFYKNDQKQEQEFIAQFEHLCPADFHKTKQDITGKNGLSLIEGRKTTQTDKHPYFLEQNNSDIKKETIVEKVTLLNEPTQQTKDFSTQIHADNSDAPAAKNKGISVVTIPTNDDLENTAAAAQKATARSKMPLAFILFILLFLFSLIFFWWMYGRQNEELDSATSEQNIVTEKLQVHRSEKPETAQAALDKEIPVIKEQLEPPKKSLEKKKPLPKNIYKKQKSRKEIPDKREASSVKKHVPQKQQLPNFDAQNATKWIHVLPYLKAQKQSSCAQTFLKIFNSSNLSPQSAMGTSAFSIRNCVLKSNK